MSMQCYLILTNVNYAIYVLNVILCTSMPYCGKNIYENFSAYCFLKKCIEILERFWVLIIDCIIEWYCELYWVTKWNCTVLGRTRPIFVIDCSGPRSWVKARQASIGLGWTARSQWTLLFRCIMISPTIAMAEVVVMTVIVCRACEH